MLSLCDAVINSMLWLLVVQYFMTSYRKKKTLVGWIPSEIPPALPENRKLFYCGRISKIFNDMIKMWANMSCKLFHKDVTLKLYYQPSGMFQGVINEWNVPVSYKLSYSSILKTIPELGKKMKAVLLPVLIHFYSTFYCWKM